MSESSHNANGAERDEWLVRFAVTNLLDYILDTEDLSVIRGSSVELDDFVKGQAQAIEDSGKGIRTIYAKASEMLISTHNETTTKWVVQELENRFKKGDSRLATAASAIVNLPAGQLLESAIRELEAKLRRQQMCRPSVVPPERLDGSGACEIEGVRPADGGSIWYKDARPRNVSQHVKRRYEQGRLLRAGLVGLIFPQESENYGTDTWEQSFDDLETYNRPDEIEPGTNAAVARSGSVCGKMCVLHADGNKFNARRSSLEGTDALKEFASLVEDATKAALQASLGNLWDRAQVYKKMPFHLLYWAGDEFTLVLPAAYGVGAMTSLLESFSQTAEAEFAQRPKLATASQCLGGTLTLAVGAVFCDTHEPIQRAHSLAQELAESAKRCVANPYDADQGNIADFIVIESGFLPEREHLAAHRKETLSAPWLNGSLAIGRPFVRNSLKKLVCDV